MVHQHIPKTGATSTKEFFPVCLRYDMELGQIKLYQDQIIDICLNHNVRAYL